jgi:hypothetical protein
MREQNTGKSVSLELRSGPGAVKRPQQRLPPKASKCWGRFFSGEHPRRWLIEAAFSSELVLHSAARRPC